ncbi:MAG TPA: ABC-2 family transporter protein, partial [bacterium]|nr:ABC-2 family transporter protein [bacterium]
MTAALARRADAYLAIIRIGFLIPLAFRLFPFMMVLSYPITMTGNYFLYRAIYASQGNAPIAGLTMEQSITYILVGWTVRSFFNIPIARQIGERVKSGQIASDLIKPVDFFALMFCQGVGRCLHRLAFISGPLILMILFSRVVVMPQHPETYGFFLGSCLLGFFIH